MAARALLIRRFAFPAVVAGLVALALVPTSAGASGQPMRRVVLLGLKVQGTPVRFAAQVSDPASASYRKFLTPSQFRSRFSATTSNQKRVRNFLSNRRGVGKVQFNPGRTTALVTVTPKAAKHLFCAKGSKLPVKGTCKPARLRGAVRQVSVGESYPAGRKGSAAATPAKPNGGTPQGCQEAVKTGAFTPNQLSTAYEVEGLHNRGLDGSGIRVTTLSSQMVETSGFKTWAGCFGMPAPKVSQVAMPGGVKDTGTAPDETVLDIEALASLAPGLERITPIFVPLDQGFSNSLLLFLFGALDPARQGGELPDILSISDGVCEIRFTDPELQLGQRLLAELSAQGVTSLAASGDLGFQGCFTSASGAMFPSSSRFVTSIGGTDLALKTDNSIGMESVWSTYATQPSQGVGSGGGPSARWARPGFQTSPGIGPELQPGKQTRLAPDLAAMASFTPGLSVYDSGDSGWGVGGGTSAATPLTAAMVALALQQEHAAGRPNLGSLPPLLYGLGRGLGYQAIFSDVTEGTSSRKPKSAAGQKPSGGQAQFGYDMATGLGSLKAVDFADAVAGLVSP